MRPVRTSGDYSFWLGFFRHWSVSGRFILDPWSLSRNGIRSVLGKDDLRVLLEFIGTVRRGSFNLGIVACTIGLLC